MSLRVLHLPSSVGGHAWGLSRGEREIGITSDVLLRNNNWLNYPSDIDLQINNSDNKLEKAYKMLKGFFKIYGKYDVYHFNFGSSLIDIPNWGINLLDVPFYGRDRKIVVTYNGCDARQKYATIDKYDYSACHRDGCYDGTCLNKKLEDNKKERIAKFAKYANCMLAVNPDLLSFLPKSAVFFPYAISEWNNIEKIGVRPRKEFHIVHAPTNRICKGSDYVIEACKRVKEKYHDYVKISLVEKIPNEEALKIYADADLIIDQVLIGWYGGFAVEALKMGKPVMCFIRKSDLQYIPRIMADECEDAIINVDKDSIFDKICELIENRDELIRYADRGWEYVNNWHDPIKLAHKMNEYYQS